MGYAGIRSSPGKPLHGKLETPRGITAQLAFPAPLRPG